MGDQSLSLKDVQGKTILLGVSYYDVNGELLHQKQLAGKVVKVTEEDGLTLLGIDNATEFTIPSDLSPWFIAPEGDFHDPGSGKSVRNPDYLVTWDVHKTKKDTPEGQHEWWEWRPQLTQPSVNK